MVYKFLITGAHGDLGLSVAKILKKNFKKSKIYGTDIIDHGPGDFIFNKVYKVPKVSSKLYKNSISKIIKNVNLTIPCTDSEIYFFNKTIKKKKNLILINNNYITNLFKEKISTNNFLKKNFPEFSLKFCYKLKKSILQNKISFPIFSKKNIGSGNKNYNKINNLKELKEINLKSDYIIQEYLEEKYEEYTSAIIRIDSVKKVLIFKRKIHSLGHTYYAETISNKILENKMMLIADKINLNGCINIQFKKIDKRIIIFDINPRLSSTVLFRDMIGFKDCVWWINSLLKFNKKFANIKIKKAKLFKSFSESFIK